LCEGHGIGYFDIGGAGVTKARFDTHRDQRFILDYEYRLPGKGQLTYRWPYKLGNLSLPRGQGYGLIRYRRHSEANAKSHALPRLPDSRHNFARYSTKSFESVRNLWRYAVYVVADNGVTLACHIFELLAVNNNDPAPAILNGAHPFELTGYQSDRRSLYP
jgi:hypothetical protein